MAVFAIDKKLANSPPLFEKLGQGILNQFNFQAPQAPEGKQRMIFKNLQTTDGNSLPNVEMYIDPQSIQTQKKVLQKKQLTKGGFVIQFWGHDLTQIQVNCITGNFQPLYGVQMTLPPDLNKKNTESWYNQVKERWMKGGGPLKVFEKLKDWVYQDRFSQVKRYEGFPLIELIWEDFIYEGYFTNFVYNIQSTQPFNIAFNFTFIITQRKDMSLEDVFGTLDPKKLIGDPVGTLVSKAKQSTDVLMSKGRKELSKLADKLPSLGGINAKSLGLDDLPSKMTLW
jgi:hypothetical protein